MLPESKICYTTEQSLTGNLEVSQIEKLKSTNLGKLLLELVVLTQ